MAETGQEVPSGVIVMWSGAIANIPSGWFLCDGGNGTPDLRDRFIVGATQDDSGVAKSNIEGVLKQTSDTGVMPAHTHTALNHTVNGGTYTGGGDTIIPNGDTTGSTGTGTKVIPVYYALALIMKS